MDISRNGIEFLKTKEDLRLEKYYDSAGLPTIGYGHLIKAGESVESPITLETAEQLLRDDLAPAVAAVNRAVKVHLTQNQFDALVSLTYNIGVDAFKRSTLVKYINSDLKDKAIIEFMKWVNAGGRRVDGLIKRRYQEALMFMSYDTDRIMDL